MCNWSAFFIFSYQKSSCYSLILHICNGVVCDAMENCIGSCACVITAIYIYLILVKWNWWTVNKLYSIAYASAYVMVSLIMHILCRAKGMVHKLKGVASMTTGMMWRVITVSEMKSFAYILYYTWEIFFWEFFFSWLTNWHPHNF